jgi:hypothetical protein
MSASLITSSIGVWAITVAAALAVAAATGSVTAWAVALFLALLPVMQRVMAGQTPAKSMAEVIRDVEAGRPE